MPALFQLAKSSIAPRRTFGTVMAQSGAQKARAFAYQVLRHVNWMGHARAVILAPPLTQSLRAIFWLTSWANLTVKVTLAISLCAARQCAASPLVGLVGQEPVHGAYPRAVGI